MEVVQADAVEGTGLERAMEGIEVAYFLIHSMDAGANGSFSDRERRGG